MRCTIARPRPVPRPFRRKIREEEFFLVGVGNAAAGIGDFDHDAMRRAARGDAHLAALGRFDGVLQQVADRAADLLGIHQQLDVGSTATLTVTPGFTSR